MKVMSVIEDEKVIKKLLTHLGLWEVVARPLPPMVEPPSDTPSPISIIPTRILDSSVTSRDQRKV
jgi:hypothetical protein